ncbi:putative disease resistance protein RGA4 [Cocos nucifera]|nr:putative disease resistance protein RGA4 [Cocos nucifera]
MAMILDAFVYKFAELLIELAKEEADMPLRAPGEIKKLQNKLRKISKVLADAERKRINDEAVDDWLKELKDFMYDADDILDLCRNEADKCSEGSSSTSSEVTSQNSRKTSPGGEIHIVGSEIEEHTHSLVDLLIKDDRRRNILVFAIVGAWGIVKTTLAKRIYNDRRIEEWFSVKNWVCVSQDFDDINLLKDIYGGTKDDLAGDQSSRILVTARNEQIAKQMMAVNTHHVNKLSLEDGYYSARRWS